MNGFGRNWLLATVILAIVVAIFTGAVFPNSTSEIITLFFSAIVAIATIFYTMLTSELLSETRKTREVQTDPKILVEVRPKYVRAPEGTDEMLFDLAKNPEMNLNDDRLEFDLIVKNIGPGPAYDITPEIIKNTGGVELPEQDENQIKRDYKNKLMQSLNTRLYEPRAFKSGGINYIGPNAERSFFFWDVSVGNYLYIKHLLADKTVKIEVKYYKYPKEMREGSEKPFNDIYSLDFPYVVELIYQLIPRLVKAGHSTKQPLSK